jgi:hypothetical protein
MKKSDMDLVRFDAQIDRLAIENNLAELDVLEMKEELRMDIKPQYAVVDFASQESIGHVYFQVEVPALIRDYLEPEFKSVPLVFKIVKRKEVVYHAVGYDSDESRFFTLVHL